MRANSIWSTLLLIIVSLSTLPIYAQSYKIIDKSSPKPPGWLGAVEKNYLITSSNESTIERCKEDILRQIKLQIASSVSQRVNSTTTMTTEQTVSDQSITAFMEQLSEKSTIRTENIPYLTAISLSKAEDYYWELHRDKKSKVESYFYTVKYPFYESEIMELVMAFEEKEKSMNDQLQHYIDQVDKIDRIEDIERNIRELNALYTYFTDSRKERVTATILNYRNLYNAITIQRVNIEQGRIQFQLTVNGRAITTATKPTLESNCASDIHIVNPNSTTIEVAYSSANCFANEENYIHVTYKIGAKRIQERFIFSR